MIDAGVYQKRIGVALRWLDSLAFRPGTLHLGQHAEVVRGEDAVGRRLVQDDAHWNAFGFIGAEADLTRANGPCAAVAK